MPGEVARVNTSRFVDHGRELSFSPFRGVPASRVRARAARSSKTISREARRLIHLCVRETTILALADGVGLARLPNSKPVCPPSPAGRSASNDIGLLAWRPVIGAASTAGSDAVVASPGVIRRSAANPRGRQHALVLRKSGELVWRSSNVHAVQRISVSISTDTHRLNGNMATNYPYFEGTRRHHRSILASAQACRRVSASMKRRRFRPWIGGPGVAVSPCRRTHCFRVYRHGTLSYMRPWMWTGK